jgi:hypothetical protein
MVENKLTIVENIAESLRQEPYRLFQNDCFTKSMRFRSECRRIGVKAYLVWCALGLTKIKLPFLGEIIVPYCTHFWGEIQGKRFETSRPLGSRGILGIVPSKIQAVLTLRF